MKNVCIVGYGAIGPVHADALAAMKSAKLYAVCDIDAEAAKRCKAQYDVVIYHDYDEMLQDKDIDAVHICTPHYLHYEMIRKALAWGKEVISEKPITMKPEEFEALLQLEGSERVCAVLQNRHNPCVKELKRLIDSGELGEIKAIKGMVTWHRDEAYYQSGAWRGKWATEGGGALINQSVHTLDLMIYLAGEVECVQASMHNHSLQGVIEVEDTVEAYLKFEGGLTGLFYATNAYPVGTDPEIEVVGSKATARYAYKKLMLNCQVIAEDAQPTVGKGYWGSGHTALIADYYENQQHFSPQDITNTMRTMFGIYESAREQGKECQIKSAE